MISRYLKWFGLSGLTLLIMSSAAGGSAKGESVSPEWSKAMTQTRWPFDKRKGQVNDNSVAAVAEALLVEGKGANAIEVLRSSVGSQAPEELLVAITKDGVRPDLKEAILLARDRAYHYALLSALTGQEGDRATAKAILFRFAETMPQWPYYAKGGIRHERKDRRYLTRWDSWGIWGKWHPEELAQTLPLLKAYDLLRESLTPEERIRVEEGIFFQHKKTIEQFTGITPIYHNLAGYHLIPLIHFGIVLQRPDYVHEVVRYWREMLQYSYSPDGFFRELSPDYHQQITRRLITSIPSLLKGYSDPVGYTDPVDGSRFENLDLLNEERHRIEVIGNALRPLVLPDGSYVALNDATPRKLRAPDASLGDQPGLLGASGVAKLGANGMAVYLQFDGIRGHDHDDALNLAWFAGGREVFSETGYRSIPDSNSTREWHTITASHHTIAVDEKTQFSDRSFLKLPRAFGAVAVYPLKDPQSAEETSVAAQLPAAARFPNQGRLLVWDVTNPQMQAMEAEHERAYPDVTSLFRRTVVMLPTGNGEGILVDLFRIRGGKRHDSFLRGGYEVSSMEFNRPLQPAEGTLYSYIQIRESAPVDNQWIARITYADGFSTESHVAGLWGGDAVKQEILVGTAPRLLAKGDTPIAIFRRTSEDGKPLESCYLFVHEAAREKRIRKVSAIPNGMDVVVVIERDGGRDLIFSGLTEESRFAFEGWQFTGSLAYARVEGDKVSGHLFSGGALKHESNLVAEGKHVHTGQVIATTRKEAGDSSYSILVAAEEDSPSRTYRLAHIDFGDVVRFSIPVVKVSREGAGQLRVELAHTPGFTMTEKGAAMTQFPGWRITGDIRARLE